MKSNNGPCRRNTGSWIGGIILIAFGVIFLLKTLGVIQISIWEGFKTFWPIGLILMGIALIMRMRWLAFTFFVITVIAGGLYAADRISFGENMVTREMIQNIPLEKEVKDADIRISYGAGEFEIGPGDSTDLVKNIVRTADLQNPVLEYKKTGTEADVTIKRAAGAAFWNGKKDSWNVLLSPDVIYSVNLDYGASNAKVDMNGLRIKNLEINNGASDTEIIFGNYPTKANIQTGASSVSIKFPKDAGVIVRIDSGLVTKNFDGLKKRGESYISDSYDPDKQNIEVSIDAGASDISTKFY
jgi:hypothetical protein